jgi:hypothetical protein
MSMGNVTSYLEDADAEQNMLRFKCVKVDERNKRVLEMPGKKIEKEIDEMLEIPSKPIVIFPILIAKKFICAIPNRSKHVNYVLYNSKTHEVERIDIKKFHLKRFPIKLLYKKISTDLLDRITEYDPKVKMSGEIDISNEFISRFPEITTKNLYPVYLILYLSLRCKHPSMNSDRVHAKVAKLSDRDVRKYWEGYLEHVDKIGCGDDHVLNSETMKCIKRGSARYAEGLIEKPVKQCKNGKVFDIFTNKCTMAAKLRNVDVVLDEILKINIGSKFKFTHMGKANNVIKSTMFVLGKHNNGHLVMSRNVKTNDKNTFMIRWIWDKEKKENTLTMPEGFWESWQEGMDGEARFVIALIIAISNLGGIHANVLIYDKNTHELERFDSLGHQAHGSFELENFDKQIIEVFEKHKNNKQVHKDYKYYVPLDYCPREIYQARDIDEIGFMDTAGNCAVWRLWYIDLRLSNPELKRDEVIKMSMKKIENYGSFQRFIKLYQAYIMMKLT